MRPVYDKDGVFIGRCNDHMTKPQRRRKEQALHRLLFSIEKEQKEFDRLQKLFPLHIGHTSMTAPYIDRMQREVYNLRSKLGICTDEQLADFHERMINP